ncbi:MAG: hypothetical protein ACRCZI_02580 [Cetobacterium sp.]
MDNYIMFVIIIILIFLLSDKRYNYADTYTKKKKTTNERPLYFNLDLEKVCGSSKKDQSSIVDDETRYKYLSECQREKVKDCPREKTLEEQLEEQKEMVKNLKLELEDRTPIYDYNKSDRYFIDPEKVSGDDQYALRMQEMMKQSKRSTDNRSKWSTNSLIPYIEEELQMHANSGGWWEDDNLETLM